MKTIPLFLNSPLCFYYSEVFWGVDEIPPGLIMNSHETHVKIEYLLSSELFLIKWSPADDFHTLSLARPAWLIKSKQRTLTA